MIQMASAPWVSSLSAMMLPRRNLPILLRRLKFLSAGRIEGLGFVWVPQKAWFSISIGTFGPYALHILFRSCHGLCIFSSLLQVLMERTNDVRLELGFHCVVNRSQKDIDEGMSREDLLEKERKVFFGE